MLTPRTARPVPLLLVLHGRDTTPAQELVRTGFADLAAHGDAVLAYPAGVGRSWNARTGCLKLWTSCRAGGRVALARWDGLAHRWPGTGWVDPDATARQLIWRFLTSRPA